MYYGNSLLCHRHWKVFSEPAGVPLSMLGQVDFMAFQSCIPSVYVVPGVNACGCGVYVEACVRRWTRVGFRARLQVQVRQVRQSAPLTSLGDSGLWR